MRIAFDAKRAYNNSSGLGNYSRYTISSLCHQFPENEYLLYTPDAKSNINFQLHENAKVITPERPFYRKFKSYWRSIGLTNQLVKDRIDLYHGLSNELPFGIQKTGIKSVVTIHDLIFMRLPELYNNFDRKVYLRKTINAVAEADRIIAISQQTRNDLIELVGADENKIDIIYQGCHPWFYTKLAEEVLHKARHQYKLPEKYILYVGTIEKRKNLLKIVEALHRGNINIPLVAVGKETPYMKEVTGYISQHNLKNVHFIHYIPNSDLPAVYQMANAFVYPSSYEGFGIPVLEALNSGIPVITSRGGCLEETAGEGGLFVNPDEPDELISAIKRVTEESDLRDYMIKAGHVHALKFRPEQTIPQLYEVYNRCFI